MHVRDEVVRFSEFMELTLRKHDADRGERGWDECSDQYLQTRLIGEVAELCTALLDKEPDGVCEEALDIANFAMMLWSNARRNEPED